MTGPLHLSRLTLKTRAPDVEPLLELLQPADDRNRLAVEHKLVWTAMPEDVREAANRERASGQSRSSFLWRADRRRGEFFVLGPKPRDEAAFFTVESKPFEPEFAPGDRLAFDLRVNATVDRKIREDEAGKAVRQRCDVAMDLIARQEKAEGRTTRPREKTPSAVAEEATREWLQARASASGFELSSIMLEGYRAERFRRSGKSFATLGIFDLKGTLVVTDPSVFIERLGNGFGRAKAFGCGLMLVRRIA